MSKPHVVVPRYPCRWVIGFLGLVLFSAEMSAAPRDLMLQANLATTEPLVNYCVANSPRSSAAVKEGFATFTARLSDAIDVQLARTPPREWPESIPPDLAKEMDAVGKKMVENVRHMDPDKYCPWLAERMKSTTKEAILRSLEEYEAKVKAARATDRRR